VTQPDTDPPQDGWDEKTAKLAACLRLLIDLERHTKNSSERILPPPAANEDFGGTTVTS
jgi:hypothetical protein